MEFSSKESEGILNSWKPA